MTLTRSLLVFLLLGATTAQAQLIPRDEIEQPDDETLKLPPYPSEANLIGFDPGFVSAFTYFIDTASLKVGKEDRVVRYTLVIRSKSGASNVSYEGLRCANGEKKIWAYGNDEKKEWMKARDPQWKALDNRDAHRHTLYESFFCPRTGMVGSVREAVDVLRAGAHRDAPFGRSSDLH